METLWSPWRSQYIGTFKEEANKSKESCFFCEALENPNEDIERLVIWRYANCIVLLNKFPYNNGHVLVAPNCHKGELHELNDLVLSEMMIAIKTAISALEILYQPHGYNVGANLGRAAGAGVPGHVHWHVIPRWNGDTSFTSTISDVKVVSIAIEETQTKLSKIFQDLHKS